MTSITIYKNTGGVGFTSYFVPDNMENFHISKTQDVMPFPLPLVDETDTTTYPNTDITEKIDLVAISGVNCSISMSFWISLTDISTISNMVTNRVSTNFMIQVNEWATGGLTNYKFYGRFTGIDIDHNGGTVNRMKVSASFQVGSIVSFGEGI